MVEVYLVTNLSPPWPQNLFQTLIYILHHFSFGVIISAIIQFVFLLFYFVLYLYEKKVSLSIKPQINKHDTAFFRKQYSNWHYQLYTMYRNASPIWCEIFWQQNTTYWRRHPQFVLKFKFFGNRGAFFWRSSSGIGWMPLCYKEEVGGYPADLCKGILSFYCGCVHDLLSMPIR